MTEIEMAWSFDKPTKAGVYLCNLGDVVTTDNLSIVPLVGTAGNITDVNGLPADLFNEKCRGRAD